MQQGPGTRCEISGRASQRKPEKVWSVGRTGNQREVALHLKLYRQKKQGKEAVCLNLGGRGSQRTSCHLVNSACSKHLPVRIRNGK